MLGVDVSPDALFDVQVNLTTKFKCKRLHEYKRQFMNILAVIHRYLELKAMDKNHLKRVVPRVGT